MTCYDPKWLASGGFAFVREAEARNKCSGEDAYTSLSAACAAEEEARADRRFNAWMRKTDEACLGHDELPLAARDWSYEAAIEADPTVTGLNLWHEHTGHEPEKGY